ncbi:hypothetical protein B0T19DRAFT_398029 [Cercophora scortea]|uniref:Uncharacterized protein n=1 Tax=Cercophora scortea TaxID=314031 RepID=A0AAE0MGZ6_9PEZI|nr:hypothetical protein B0T19DRAFT_398029 [Cercophora scortea]
MPSVKQKRSRYSQKTKSWLQSLIPRIEEPRRFEVPELLLTLTAWRPPRSTTSGRGPHPPAMFNEKALTRVEYATIQNFVEDYFEPSDPLRTVCTEAERDLMLRELIYLNVDDFDSFYQFLLRVRLLRLYLHQDSDYREALLARVLIKGLIAHDLALSEQVLDITNGAPRRRRTNRLLDYIAREADGEADVCAGGSPTESSTRSNDHNDDSTVTYDSDATIEAPLQ